MKIVINNCFGGFSLSPEADKYYLSLKGLPCFFYTKSQYKHRDGYDLYEKRELKDLIGLFSVNYVTSVDLGDSFTEWPKNNEGYFYSRYLERNDPLLIKTIEDLGSKIASGDCASLRIIEIPDDVEWVIDEYDGLETIHEKHRSWG